MNMRLAYVLFFFSLIIAFYLGVYKTTEEPTTFREPQSVMPATEVSPVPPSANESAQTSPSAANRMPAGELGLSEEAFLRKYGDHLKWMHGRNGEVIGIQAKSDRLEQWDKHQRATGNFHPRNREQVLARAEEVIRDAQKVLRIDPRFPLARPELMQTDFTAQVIYDQTYEGVPMSQGKVNLLFGPEGQLRSLESDYVRGVKVTNRNPASQGSGRTILWVDRRTEDSAQTKYARETREDGIQTIRDAETGQVLYRRNRRIH